MAAYILANVHVDDASSYGEYLKGVPETVTKYGGKFLARGGEVELLEGDGKPGRVVVLEFPSAADAKKWYYSPEYTALRSIRVANSTGTFFLTQGV
jgi:uncharacterized protein (DUF1330 family)